MSKNSSFLAKFSVANLVAALPRQAFAPLRLCVRTLAEFLRLSLLAISFTVLFLPVSTRAAAIIQLGGLPAELVVSEISDHTLRLQLIPAGSLPVPSTVLAPFPLIERFRARQLPQPKELRVGRLRISIHLRPLTVSMRRPDGHLVQELVFEDATNGAYSLSFQMPAPLLGLGEGAQQFDRRGSLYPMVNGQLAPLLATHGATIPVPFLIGTDGWAMFVNEPWGAFDLRNASGKFLPAKNSGAKEPLDLFLIDAPEPAIAMAEYIRLTGHPVMPPKWVLGYIQSHRTLANPQEPLQIAETFRAKKLPCDALIYLGTGYCTNGWNTGHGSLEFNPQSFDHPAQQLTALHDLNFKVILHINHAPRDLFGGSFAEPSDSPLHIRNYWARHRPDFALGVDGWWPDDGDELPIEARLARHRCYFEGPLLDRPNVRPWSLHRNGYAGVARYGGWLWSGDTMSRWATLAAHVPVALNYSLSLTPFWGSDTGGFVPTSELTGELYVRWFQFSAFNPLFRSHGRTWHLRLPWGWNTGETGPIESRDVTDRAELHNAAVEPICRKYLELRYRLLPYNYSLIREACDTGLPLMRALWLQYPHDAEAVKLGDQYLWGRDLLVAPVVEKAPTSRRLYLPAGDWFDWWSGQKVAGGSWLERPVDLATLPLYARAGAIIPLDPVRQYTAQPVSEPTTLQVYSGANGSFTLYDDDGLSLDYQRGVTTWTRILWNDHSRTLTIEPASKLKPIQPRRFEVLLLPENVRRSTEYSGRRVQVKL
jgi:alpha-glucosidase/alpha-D-xyloside xylohydrolase